MVESDTGLLLVLVRFDLNIQVINEDICGQELVVMVLLFVRIFSHKFELIIQVWDLKNVGVPLPIVV